MMYPPQILGSIRRSERRDAPELARLFASARLDVPTDYDEMLVLDLDGRLRAAAQVVVGSELTRLQVLVLDPSLDEEAHRQIEERMLAIVHAMGSAYGSDVIVSS